MLYKVVVGFMLLFSGVGLDGRIGVSPEWNVYMESGLIMRLEQCMTQLEGLDDGEDVNMMIGVMLSVRDEVAGYLGEAVSVNQKINQFCVYLESKGMRLSKSMLESYKKRVRGVEKRGLVEDSDEEKIPVMAFDYGMTVSVCGMLIKSLPIPAARAWGGMIIEDGVLSMLQE